MDADLGDAVRLAEADVLPGLTAVAAPVHAVAGQDVAADAGLAGADEDEIGVGLADRDRADRRSGDLEVGDGIPVLTAVRRLPEAAAGGAEVGLPGSALDAADRDGAAAAVGTEVAPGVAGHEGRVEGDLLGLGVERGCKRGQAHHVREVGDPHGDRCAGQARSDCEECRDEQERLEGGAFHCSNACGFGSWYWRDQATEATEDATSGGVAAPARFRLLSSARFAYSMAMMAAQSPRDRSTTLNETRTPQRPMNDALIRPRDIRDVPACTFLEAARYLGIPPATLRYWVLGSGFGRGNESAASQPAHPHPRRSQEPAVLQQPRGGARPPRTPHRASGQDGGGA